MNQATQVHVVSSTQHVTVVAGAQDIGFAASDTAEGTGFVFDQMTPRAIYDTVGWAVWTWYNRPDHIDIMRRRAMQQRFSWSASADRYVELYQWAIDRRSGKVPRT